MLFSASVWCSITRLCAQLVLSDTTIDATNNIHAIPIRRSLSRDCRMLFLRPALLLLLLDAVSGEAAVGWLSWTTSVAASQQRP